MNRKSNTIIPLLLMIGMFTGCGGDRENDPVPVTFESLEVALQESVSKIILPTVNQFVDDSVAIQNLSESFCSNASTESLLLVQQSWIEVSNSWFKLAAYNFGPLNDDLVFPKYTFIDSLRLRGTNYLGTVRTEISRNLINEELLDAAFFERLTFQKTGLLLLEALLFETSSEQSTELANIVSEYQFNNRKCELLIGAANALERNANYVQYGWLTSYRQSANSFEYLFLNDLLEDDSDPLALILVAVQNHLDYLQKRNVVTISASLAGNSWQQIDASITEIEKLLNGTSDTTTSYFYLMEVAGFDNSVNLVKENIQRIRQAIELQQSDLLASELGRLDGNFKREIPDALAVELGINFTDGD